ncbi:unnamed protein product, partial [Didymodactylos carnosus]
MKILVDTGASTTFIDEKSLRSTKHLKFINKNQYSFVFADGVAPFYVIGVVELTIKFGDQNTKVYAHIAKNLCSDLILGMDYMNRHNVKIDIKAQTVPIEGEQRLITIDYDKQILSEIFPVTLTKPVKIDSNSNNLVK